MNNLILTAALALMASTLYWLYQREARKGSRARADIFGECTSLLAQASQTSQASGFPTLKGNYQGYQVVLAVHADTLSVRKLPPLWLTVTLRGKQRTRGSLDIMVRPQNTGFHSPAWDWDDSVVIPPGWPQHALVKYRGAVAPLDLLDAVVPGLFSDERMKELLVTPDVVRLTYMAKQADRGEYLLMRNAVFDGVPIPQEVVAALLQSAAGLRQQLEGANQP
ncbi:MAG: hypothetical protein JWR40_971 [Massilia sp.]|nr:hypothetical protein [Massilia sp.]MDB5949263.1 hypothetical protein [Massilia sp.]